MRIIAGTLRGRRLASPRWPGLRPSSDRLRETLFNVLSSACAGAQVLDLCAGSGAVGIEAISRGAAHVTFVDADARACRLITQNLASCAVTGGYTILRSSIERLPDVLHDGSQGVEARGGYDIVFLDAPYEHPALDRWIDQAAHVVAPGGTLVVEHARRRVLPPAAGPLVRTRQLRSGDTQLSFYAHPAAVRRDEAAGSEDPA